MGLRERLLVRGAADDVVTMRTFSGAIADAWGLAVGNRQTNRLLDLLRGVSAVVEGHCCTKEQRKKIDERIALVPLPQLCDQGVHRAFFCLFR